MPPEEEAERLASRAAGIRRNPYENIDVSLRTLDIVIAACSAATIILLLLGIFAG
ncbi:MAG: hypothetical protein LBP21_02620 [Synergistaceae bacterium]|jgi:glutamyl-tRNA reductase|nr:hypothetical protein [Synergistaceae bacterium]